MGTVGTTSKPSRVLPTFARPAARCSSSSRGVLRSEEHRQPAVGELAGELEVLRADRGDVDRDVVAHRVQHQVQRFARAVRQRQRVGRALVADPLARERQFDDVDVLAGAGHRLGEPDAVPAFGDLGAGKSETEAEPAAGEHVEGRRGHRGHRRGAGRDLQNSAADVDVLGLRGDPGEHRHGVRAVRLGGPRDGVAEPVGLLDQRERLGAAAVADVQSQLHRATITGCDLWTALCRSGEPVACQRGSAQCGTKRVEGQSPRARHDDVGCRDRRRRGSRPAGDLPRCRRHARRHRRVLRLRRDRGAARATARRRRPARRSGDRDEGRHHPHRRGPRRRLLARGAAASAGRVAAQAGHRLRRPLVRALHRRHGAVRRDPGRARRARSARARCATPGSPTTAAGASAGRRAGSGPLPGRAPIVANQMRYSLLDRGIEREVVPGVRRAGRRPVPVVAAGRRRAHRQVPRRGAGRLAGGRGGPAAAR